MSWRLDSLDHEVPERDRDVYMYNKLEISSGCYRRFCLAVLVLVKFHEIRMERAACCLQVFVSYSIRAGAYGEGDRATVQRIWYMTKWHS